MLELNLFEIFGELLHETFVLLVKPRLVVLHFRAAFCFRALQQLLMLLPHSFVPAHLFAHLVQFVLLKMKDLGREKFKERVQMMKINTSSKMELHCMHIYACTSMHAHL